MPAENPDSRPKKGDCPYYKFKTFKSPKEFFFFLDIHAVFCASVVITWIMHRNM